jgi:hypothetical protein
LNMGAQAPSAAERKMESMKLDDFIQTSLSTFVGSRHTGQDKSQPVRFFKNGLFEAIGH